MIEISVENYGKMTFDLDRENAPVTVDNFISLVNEKFYDGLIFHRVIENFMIQGGDPTGTGMGGSSKNIVGEFKSNGIDNKLKHKRGVISMARSNNPDSASSQFFICQVDCDYLNGNYAAFGTMREGFDVLDKIAGVKTDYRDKPYEEVKIEYIRETE